MDAGSVALGGFILLWVLLAAVFIAAIVLSILMLVDAAQRPDWQYEATGQSKVLWIVLAILGIAACQLVGLIAGPIYLRSVRKRLDAAVAPMYGANPFGYGQVPYPGYPPSPGQAGGPPAYGPAPGHGPPVGPLPQAQDPSAALGAEALPVDAVPPPGWPAAGEAEPSRSGPPSNAGDDPVVDGPPQPSSDR